MPERSDQQFQDTVRAISDLLDPRHSARRSGGSIMLSVREVATRMAEAGWRPPAQEVGTVADPEDQGEDCRCDEGGQMRTPIPDADKDCRLDSEPIGKRIADDGVVVVPADLFDDVDEDELVREMVEALR